MIALENRLLGNIYLKTKLQFTVHIFIKLIYYVVISYILFTTNSY